MSGIMSVNSRDLMEEMEEGREQRSVVGKRKVLRETEGRKEGRTEYNTVWREAVTMIVCEWVDR